jgi:RNA polymerase sigma factor (sigma-70 family)
MTGGSRPQIRPVGRALSTSTLAGYEADRDYVLAVLRRRCGWLDAGDREAVLHDAYAVLLEKQRDGVVDIDAMHPRQLRAYLTQTALHKALDEGKRAGRKRSRPLGEADLLVDERGRLAEEVVEAAADRERIQEILGELPERQQTIIKLRFFFDRAPEEIQRYLGVTNRVYRRELERALRRIGERFELVRDGTFCESRRSTILAFVAGIAGPTRSMQARRHLDTCRGCARWAAELRGAGQQVAAAIPMPALELGHGRLHELADRIVGALEIVKHHVAHAALRADATAAQYATGLRPGSAVAAVAGCIAMSGAATYCAVEGLPQPLSAIGIQSHSPRHSHKPRAHALSTRSSRVRSAASQAASGSLAPPAAREPARPDGAADRLARAPAVPGPDAAAGEFGPEQLGASSPSSPDAGSPASGRTPASSTTKAQVAASAPSAMRTGSGTVTSGTSAAPTSEPSKNRAPLPEFDP